MEPDNYDPRKFKTTWTYGPLTWNWGWGKQEIPPMTDEEVEKVLQALDHLAQNFIKEDAQALSQALDDVARELVVELQLEAMDLLETEVEANDCSQAQQMLDELFKRGA